MSICICRITPQIGCTWAHRTVMLYYYLLLFHVRRICDIAMTCGIALAIWPTNRESRPHNMHRKWQLTMSTKKAFTANQGGRKWDVTGNGRPQMRHYFFSWEIYEYITLKWARFAAIFSDQPKQHNSCKSKACDCLRKYNGSVSPFAALFGPASIRWGWCSCSGCPRSIQRAALDKGKPILFCSRCLHCWIWRWECTFNPRSPPFITSSKNILFHLFMTWSSDFWHTSMSRMKLLCLVIFTNTGFPQLSDWV